MKPAGILLAAVLLGSVGVTGAMAECQIADAKLEEAILNKPELRGGQYPDRARPAQPPGRRFYPVVVRPP
jgi:hypothetical protein